MRIETALDRQHDDPLARLFHESGPALWRALFAYSGGRRHIADEALAEGFAAALHHRATIREPLAWIYRTSFRHAAKELKRERQLAPLSDDDREDIPVDMRPLIEALRDLSPNQRAAIALHYHADLPVKVVAERLDMSPATVRVHLHRGRKHLRRILGTEETDD